MIPVRKAPRFPDSDYLSRYRHPHGFVIVKCRRSWSERVGAMRGTSLASPYEWWDVQKSGRDKRAVHTTPTLREAREWCDSHQVLWRDGARVVEIPA